MSTSRACGPIWLGHWLLRIGRGSMHIWHDALPVCGSVHARTRLLRQVPGHWFAEKQRPGFKTSWLAWWLNRIGDWPAGPRNMCGLIHTARWRRRMSAARVGAAFIACRAGFCKTSTMSTTAPAARLGGLSGPFRARSRLRRVVRCASCVMDSAFVGRPRSSSRPTDGNPSCHWSTRGVRPSVVARSLVSSLSTQSAP